MYRREARAILPPTIEFDSLLQSVKDNVDVDITEITVMTLFLVDKLKESPKKEWNWWWVSKHFPFDFIKTKLGEEDYLWDCEGLSANPTIKFEDVLNNPEIKWNWMYLSANPSISVSTIIENPDKKWDYFYVSRNPTFTMANLIGTTVTGENGMLKITDTFPYDFILLTENPGIREDIFKLGPSKFDCYLSYSHREEITPEVIDKACACVESYVFWDWYQLGKNPNFPWSYWEGFWKDDRLDWRGISENPNITMSIIRSEPNKPWDYQCMCLNPSITLKEFEEYNEILEKEIRGLLGKYKWFEDCKDATMSDIKFFMSKLKIKCEYNLIQPDSSERGADEIIHSEITHIFSIIKEKKLDWVNLSRHKELTFAFIKEHVSEKWDWKYISTLPIITIDIINGNPDIPWDLEAFCTNPNITLGAIAENPDFDWSWSQISLNSNMTYKIIEDNPDKPWEWDVVFSLRKYKKTAML
jgi:hypothetical protein